ncbi:Poly [ADP-ribose] polymerase 2 [Caenorhabditis elegans]|uniref:Poly [ADP-ribose] polymerase 2 n=1 Tax=Caenorhabditis elegans TaxID=6239 RepID=PARP2_CAEEL|nr:Poly [ADP-ribose] polymerase 2 [Caenorhabditis elegans]Q09525.1 RecName: Full=Poly [ADP-ribose] polymerase 2; AltName: Full=Poly ADP-ribose metabolism enzyme 2; AltName: Full=Protein poly-ADP-ribosyltransferase parp-2 [Caenorhabditis elegans]AAM27196.1 poly ADP-ribose metabolism enzyme-2 [Caenorhabditis elegans]CAA87379.1 Poly [ADP-ribose] polymerase 2 [Caenorhabditis elegans]|eukprot:NP_001022057.1 Poly [ADP-ribose] polymerase 2 [Caenorhabditis elegans]
MSIINDENGRGYKVHLCKTNIAQNNNKFYDMELLDEGGDFIVKLINGRIGYRGVTQLKDFDDLDRAKKFFESKFYEKTHLHWEERDDEPVPNKYAVVELATNARQTEKEVKKEEPEPEPKVDEKNTRGRKKRGIVKEKKEIKKEEEPVEEVNEKLKELMKCICDEDVHLGLLKQLKFNEAFGRPIDCLSLAQLTTGYEILSKIEESIGGKSARRSTRGRPRVADRVLAVKSDGPSLHDINKYYSLIPHSFGFCVPPKIDSHAKIQAERELLDALKGSIEASLELKDLKKTASSKDIYQRLYERLPCHLEPVSEEIAGKIGDCLAMRGPTHCYKLSLIDAFELKDPNEIPTEAPVEVQEVPKKRGRKSTKTAAPTVPPPTTKRLLWHGTRVTNVFSILMNGLQFPVGDRCGLMFGNGVYFANVPTKSANYCCPEASKRVFMLLCEVETANPLVLYESEIDADEKMEKAKKTSVYAAGKHTPRDTVEINGIPAFKSNLETIEEETRLLYDEYVMFNKEHFKIKYVVEVKVDRLTAKEMMA